MMTDKNMMNLKRLFAAALIVITLTAPGFAAYADADEAGDTPVTVDESEIIAIGAEPIDESETVAAPGAPSLEAPALATPMDE